jgi:hypothetical protein
MIQNEANQMIQNEVVVPQILGADRWTTFTSLNPS